ncbi:hypothetical protein BGY98DRAFT_1192090 [Russula aff. rugulosa BPL654]|nr:hypothetical protein BGY98DRAFT_1192090 [Russula aff. rugulosa BPL654]
MTSLKTGLFSATVGAFVIEFYKKLSPDSGSQTVALLQQISQQLANSPNNTNSNTRINHHLPNSDGWVNAIYVETPKSKPVELRARSAGFVLAQTSTKCLLSSSSDTPSSLVYLFSPLVITFPSFLALTQVPYRTPMSNLVVSMPHFLSSQPLLHWLVKQLHECFVPPNLDGIISSLGNANSWNGSVINGAKDRKMGPQNLHFTVQRALTDDKRKLRNLAASVPRNEILDLIRPVESEKLAFEIPFSFFYAAVKQVLAQLDRRGSRKRSLLLCLDTIHDISKTPEIPELNFVRANFANIGYMRTLWDDNDTAIRITSRSICALIARQVVRRDFEEAELRWLQDVTGETSHEILNANFEKRDQMNFKSFVRGVFSNQVRDLSTEDATSFRETLAILLDVRTDPYFDLRSSRYQLSDIVRRIYQDDPQGSHDVVNILHSLFSFIPLTFPVPIIQSVSLPSLPTSGHALPTSRHTL